MQQELSILEETTLLFQLANKPPAFAKLYPSASSSTSKSLGTFNIAHISASAFHMQACRQENTSFSTNLYEFNRLIEDKENINNNTITEEIKLKVLLQNQAYLDIFSKAASDRLPPHRSYDHRI